jgi:hypothetical protein
MSMKNFNDAIGNRSRDLLVCSAVPQTLRHRMPHSNGSNSKKSVLHNKLCLGELLNYQVLLPLLKSLTASHTWCQCHTIPPSLPYAVQARGCVGLRTILQVVVVVKNTVAMLQAGIDHQ